MAEDLQRAEALSLPELRRLVLGRWCTLRDALRASDLEPSDRLTLAALQRFFASSAEGLAQEAAAGNAAELPAPDGDRAGGASRAPTSLAVGAPALDIRLRLEQGVALLFEALSAKGCESQASDLAKSFLHNANDAATAGEATISCRSLLFELGAYAPREGFMRWASTVLLLGGSEAFNDLVGARLDDNVSTTMSCSRSVASSRCAPRYRIGRDEFREMVAMLNGNSDDAGLWHDILVEVERASTGEDGLDAYILNRHVLANTRFKAETPLGLQDIVVRLITVWGELTSAFGLTQTALREEPRPTVRGQLPMMPAHPISPIGRRGWRPSRSQWSRALCGKRGRFLLVERETRLESDRLTATEPEINDCAFPNINDRLLITKSEWRPGEVIVVRYTLAESGFWGACGPPPQCPIGPGRRIPAASLGAKPFIAAVPADDDHDPEAATDAAPPPLPACGAVALVDPQVATGSAVLQVPESDVGQRPQDGGSVYQWHLRLFASDDGLNATGALSQPLQIWVVMTPPAPPSMVTAEASGPDVASLRWTASVDDMGSSVMWCEAAIWEWDGQSNSVDDAPVWSDRSHRRSTAAGPLRPSTRYVARVRCASRAGLGPWSEASEPFETLPALPERLPPPEATAMGPTEVQLCWAYSDEVGMQLTKSSASLESRWPTKYSVQVHPMFQPGSHSRPHSAGVGLDSMVYTFESSATQALVTGLAANTQYCFEVRAHNASGAGPWSAPSECVFTHAGPPVAPAPPVSIEVAQDGLLLRWQHPVNNGGSSVTGYCLKVAPSDAAQEGGEAAGMEIYAESSPAWVRGLRGNCWYSVSVAASNALGVGPFSPPAALRTACLPPGPPVQLRATSLSAEGVSIAWEPPMDDGGGTISRYRMRALPAGPHSVVEAEVDGGVCSMVLPPLEGVAEYYVTLRAANRAGTSSESEPLRIDTEPTVPSAPCSPPRLCDEGSTKTALAIKWDASTVDGGRPIEEYEVQVLSADRLPAVRQGLDVVQLRTISAGMSLNIVVDKLSPGEAYVFAVRAKNLCGWGPSTRWSAPIRTAPPPPSAPLQPRPMDSTARSILIEWDPPESEGPLLEYEVACCSSVGAEATSRRVRTKRTESRITGLAQFASYVFRVRARNFSGWSPWSEPSEASGTTGLATLDEVRDAVLRRFGGTVSSAFRALDRNGDGFVSRDEFAAAFEDSTSSAAVEQWLRLFSAADIAGRGRLGYREFAQCFSQYKATPAVMRHHLPEMSEGHRQQLLEETYRGRRSSTTASDPRVAEVVHRLTSPSSRQRLCRAQSERQLDGPPHESLSRMSSGTSTSGRFPLRARSVDEIGETSASERSSHVSEEPPVLVRTALSPSPRRCPIAASPTRGASSPTRHSCGGYSPSRQSSGGYSPSRSSVVLRTLSPLGSVARSPGAGSGYERPRCVVVTRARTSIDSSPRVGSRAYVATSVKAHNPMIGSASTKVLEAIRHTRRHIASGPGVNVRSPPSGVVAGVAIQSVVLKNGAGASAVGPLAADPVHGAGAACN